MTRVERCCCNRFASRKSGKLGTDKIASAKIDVAACAASFDLRTRIAWVWQLPLRWVSEEWSYDIRMS